MYTSLLDFERRWRISGISIHFNSYNRCSVLINTLYINSRPIGKSNLEVLAMSDMYWWSLLRDAAEPVKVCVCVGGVYVCVYVPSRA